MGLRAGKVRESVKVLVEGLERIQREYDGTEQSIVKALTPQAA
ncbi:hypothetical protein [Kitasatospora sp. NPDC085464]